MLFKFLVAVIIFFKCALALAQPATSLVHLKTRDLTPKFLMFYDSASKTNLPADERFALWKQLYGFAATPPTPEGDSIARSLLDNAWHRYGSNLPLIKQGAGVITPLATHISNRVAGLLQPDSSISLTLLLYVGGFENNAFTAAQNGNIITAMAVETDSAQLPLLLAHELTHAVHIGMGSFSGGWQRSVGTTVLTEGLAMRVAQQVFPGHADETYTEFTPGWLVAASAKHKEILTSILPALTSVDPDDVFKFTMGTGNLGFEREAYYTGWVVVGHWLQQGKTVADIARIPEDQMPEAVRQAILEILK